MTEEYYKELFRLFEANEHYDRSVRAYRLEHRKYSPAGILEVKRKIASI